LYWRFFICHLDIYTLSLRMMSGASKDRINCNFCNDVFFSKALLYGHFLKKSTWILLMYIIIWISVCFTVSVALSKLYFASLEPCSWALFLLYFILCILNCSRKQSLFSRGVGFAASHWNRVIKHYFHSEQEPSNHRGNTNNYYRTYIVPW